VFTAGINHHCFLGGTLRYAAKGIAHGDSTPALGETIRGFSIACSQITLPSIFYFCIFHFTFKAMYHLPYNQNLKEFSRKLRNNSTLGEMLLWKQLRAGKMKGYTFNRQKPLNGPPNLPNGEEATLRPCL
jgi:hypothetical protein